MVFKSRRPNLTLCLSDGSIRFENHVFETDDQAIIRELVASKLYQHEYELSDQPLVVNAYGDLVPLLDNARRDYLDQKYPPEVVKDVSIVTGTHDNADCLQECLDSLLEYTPPGFQLIVADNASTDRTPALLNAYKKRLGKNMVILPNPDNPGFSEWNNRGVKLADRELVCYLNDDTILRRYWLESMIWLYRNKPNVGAVGKKSVNRQLQPGDLAQGYTSTQDKVAFGYCMIIDRKNAWLDEIYKIGGWEDVDLCMRLTKKQGYNIWVEREYPIVHKGSTSFNKRGDKLAVFGRNRAIFDQRWGKTDF